MHEKLPMNAYPSAYDRTSPGKGRELGVPALLIVLGMLLAYSGSLVRTQADDGVTPAPISIRTTSDTPATFAQ